MSDDIINFYKNTSFNEEPIKEKVITKEIKSVSVEIPEDDPLQDVFRTLVENLQKTKASEFNKPIEEIIEESNDEPFTKFLNNVASIIKQDDRLQTDEQIKEATIGVINKIKDEDLTFTEEKKTKSSYVPAKFLKSYPKKISSKVPVIESKEEVKNKELVVEEEEESVVKNVYVKELKTKDNRIRNPSTTDKPADLKTLVEKKVREEIDKFSQHFAQISMTAGGGGSVAVQYADGGTMRGNLNVTGKYLSGGRDLSTIFSGGGGGGNQTLSFNSNTAALSISNGNTVSLSTLSATGNLSLYLPLSGGTLTGGLTGTTVKANTFYGAQGTNSTYNNGIDAPTFGFGGTGGCLLLNGGNGDAGVPDSGDGGNGGCIDLRGGNGNAGEAATGGNGGCIIMVGSSASVNGGHSAGNIITSASSFYSGGSICTAGDPNGPGGSINTSGGGNDNSGGKIDTSFSGGFICTKGSSAANGGYINTSASGYLHGGCINTSGGGGSIKTTGSGYIQFGYDTQRTTLSGTATTNQTILLPNKSGRIALITDLSATTLKVYDKAVTYTIALSDNNSAIHLDTTSASISALFPSNLTEGFSVALMNTGTNILYLSAAIPLRSLGNGLSGLYSGAFTYIHNGAVYAVGRF